MLAGFAMSCEYQPTEVKFTEIPEPSADGISLDLSDYEPGDTIRIFNETTIYYNFELGDHEYWQTEATLGTVELQPTATYVYIPSNLSTGYYPLTVRMIVHSDNGSLADALDAEYLVKEWKYVLYVDKTTPIAPPSPRVEVTNGTIMLHWDKSDEFEFQGYEISQWYYDELNGAYFLGWSKTISDVARVSFRDSTLIRGAVKYRLLIKARDQDGQPSETLHTQGDYKVDLIMEPYSKTQVIFKWRKPELYANLKNYYGQMTFGDSFTKTDVNDTTQIVDLPLFGAWNRITLHTLAYSDWEGNERHAYESKEFIIGEAFPSFYNLSFDYAAATDRYYFMRRIGFSSGDPFNLIVMNPSTGVELASVGPIYGNFAVSPDGNHLYYQGLNNNLIKLNAETLEEIGTYDLATLQATPLGNPGHFEMSNNNVVAYSTSLNNFVIDMDQFEIIQKRNHTKDISISSSGKYVLSAGSLFEWNGADYISKGTYTFDNNHFQVAMFDKLERPLLCSDDVMNLLDVTNASVVRAISTEGNIYKHDPKTGYIGAYDLFNDMFYVYSPDQTDPVTSFPVAQNFRENSLPLIANNHLICSGQIVPLSNFLP